MKAFAAENVVIAEVGAWKNMMDPDAAKRRENRQYVAQRMALAEAVARAACGYRGVLQPRCRGTDRTRRISARNSSTPRWRIAGT